MESVQHFSRLTTLVQDLKAKDTDPAVVGPVEVDRKKIESAVRLILEAIGEDPDREGLLETPDRVARMWTELAAGQVADPADQISCEFFESSAGVVLVKDIGFSSTCEHHLLPFVGQAHIAYLPREGRITGLSKLARVVDIAAARLQVQERLTAQISQALVDKLDPLGVIVMVQAEHTCMTVRGIKKPGSSTVTIDSRGCYKEDAALRAEILNLLSRH
ncbi:MAG: GTP cyclohydrolase I FolE [Cyanobacteria bacterium SZAS LIN-3]|nr:GTP cyclohydrolase I FolE [Cyanobacteria bacterium SZAS LIN-3]MBS2007862.1 GTP cyclohydrolase I FolE [Cyanobacteria bacterium SZAS TMP-1]